MRPIDLAREHGLSTQAVRNYEVAGILPWADRTESGYRLYTPVHAQALRTFLTLIPGHGHPTATAIMVAVNQGKPDEALTFIDHSHAQLLDDRNTLDAVGHALDELATTRTLRRRPFAQMSVGALAHELGLRPTTLRRWERAGLLSPGRDAATGYRVYTADDVRDAHFIHQLRRGSYVLAQIAPLLSSPLRRPGRRKHSLVTGRHRRTAGTTQRTSARCSPAPRTSAPT